MTAHEIELLVAVGSAVVGVVGGLVLAGKLSAVKADVAALKTKVEGVAGSVVDKAKGAAAKVEDKVKSEADKAKDLVKKV